MRRASSDTTNPAADRGTASDAAAQDSAAISGSFAVSDQDVGDTLTASVIGSPARAAQRQRLRAAENSVDVAALIGGRRVHA